MPILSHSLKPGIQERLGATTQTIIDELGFLADLPGTWSGRGFNMIARPNFQNKSIFFLQVNATTETIEFDSLAGAVPNRGSAQDDIMIRAVTYKQIVSDLASHAGLHVETGIWTSVPSSTIPKQPATYVRQAAIPHGDALVAQSTFTLSTKAPQFDPVDSTPFPIVAGQAVPGLNQVPNPHLHAPLGYLDPFLHVSLPDGLPPGLSGPDTVRNPNLILAADIAGQNITRTLVVQISTAAPGPEGAPAGGIVNIPFVVKNANAIQMDAIFWIETVEPAGGDPFLQLQYVQRVILDFDNIHWPHISVATLVKQ